MIDLRLPHLRKKKLSNTIHLFYIDLLSPGYVLSGQKRKAQVSLSSM